MRKKEKAIEVIAIKRRNRKIEKDLGKKNTRNKNKINIDLEMTNRNIQINNAMIKNRKRSIKKNGNDQDKEIDIKKNANMIDRENINEIIDVENDIRLFIDK